MQQFVNEKSGKQTNQPVVREGLKYAHTEKIKLLEEKRYVYLCEKYKLNC